MTRFGYVMLAYFAAMGTVATAFIDPSPRLIWNASASVPVGLYSLRSAKTQVGALVLIVPPEPLERFLAERHYLPRGVPMLKHVAALAGQRVCRTGLRITIDGKPAGAARATDRKGRDLPVWDGCRVLGKDEVFLMNLAAGDSLDGRYFGPLSAASIVGQLSPLWVERAR